MRIQSALGLSVGVMLSCTAENPAYTASGEGSTSGTAPPVATSTTVSESTSGSSLESDSSPSSPTHDSGTLPGSGTTADPSEGTATDTESDVRCWSTSISILPIDGVPLGETLTNVPVKVATSGLAPEFNRESLRFYQDGTLLPHELEGVGRFAWVQLAELNVGDTPEVQARMGAACPPDAPLDPSRVWSAGYVAVFHFDDEATDPLIFVDSVNEIELVPDANTEVGDSKELLGPYARKFGDGRLEATNMLLDISGNAPVSTLGWVRIDPGEAGVLPWDRQNARHRELIAKLPGYRLNAVRGETGPASAVAPAPFFNLSQEVPSELQDNLFGPAPVQADQWTMLAGTYDGAVMQLFHDGDLVGTGNTQYVPGSNNDGSVRVGRWLRGGVDEIRISNVVRSSAWIRIQHASMMETLLDYAPREPFDP